MPRKGGRRRKARTHVVEPTNANEKDNTPKSFVFKMGKAPGVIQNLVTDMRRVMAPYTADRLREQRKNSLKDFLQVAAPLGVTHFLFFTHTDAGTNLKIARIPRGPTLSFKVVSYSLMQHVHALHKRPVDASAAFKTKPLVVLNNFTSQEDHIKLLNVTFQHLFPPLDVQTVQLSECRRVVLFHYDSEEKVVQFRHYLIRAAPVGLSKSVKTIVKSKVPDLSKLEDISQYVLGEAAGNVSASDSEVDDESAHVTLPDNFRGRGNAKSEKSAVRLTEIGPRMTLQLTKVERELCEGDVLYHAFIQKTPEESAKAKAKREQAQALKRKRREEQEANVAKKQEKKQAKKDRKKERVEVEEDDDDAEYYRQEVGEAPDETMFQQKKKAKTNVEQAFNTMAPTDKRPRMMKAQPKGRAIRQRKQH